MDGKHTPNDYNSQRYNPVKREWKVFVSLTISALLILGIAAVGWMFAYFDRCSSSGLLCPLILSMLFTTMVVICICILVLKLISLYATNLAKETDVLSSLYKEEEKGRIVQRDKANTSSSPKKIAP